jgi:hypothetical protein
VQGKVLDFSKIRDASGIFVALQHALCKFRHSPGSAYATSVRNKKTRGKGNELSGNYRPSYRRDSPVLIPDI